MTLDDVLSDPDWRTRHERRVAAPPAVALAAARAVTIRDMPLAAVLLALRGFGRPPPIPFVDLVERRVGLARLGENVWGGLSSRGMSVAGRGESTISQGSTSPAGSRSRLT
jgi:hypothetical protein